MREQRAPDAMVARTARCQHGAVSIGQLRDAGVTDAGVMRRVRAGRLHKLYRGVYAVGHIAPSHERRWMAAVLALGNGAALSHRSAAALWELLPPRDGPVDVSLPSRNGRRRRQGILLHRPVSLESIDITRARGIPVTTPARTLADLRASVTGRELRRAIRQADFLGLPTGPETVSDRTRSELERRFLWLCHRHQVPMPMVNMRIAAMTVDFCWVEQRLIVETDGYRSHRGREAFEDDRARALRLRALGYEVMPLSHRQVFDEPAHIAAVLKATLKRAGARY